MKSDYNEQISVIKVMAALLNLLLPLLTFLLGFNLSWERDLSLLIKPSKQGSGPSFPSACNCAFFFFLRGKGIGIMKPFQINVFNRQVSWNNVTSLSVPKLPNAISSNWQAPANVKLCVLSCEYQTTHSIGKHPVMIPQTEGSSFSFFYAWKNNVSLLFRIENFNIH